MSHVTEIFCLNYLNVYRSRLTLILLISDYRLWSNTSLIPFLLPYMQRDQQSINQKEFLEQLLSIRQCSRSLECCGKNEESAWAFSSYNSQKVN